jgi:hypothetical protein
MLPRWSNATCVTNDTTSPQGSPRDVCIGCGNLANPTQPPGSSTVRGKAPATTELRVVHVFTRGGYAHTLSIIPMSCMGISVCLVYEMRLYAQEYRWVYPGPQKYTERIVYVAHREYTGSIREYMKSIHHILSRILPYTGRIPHFILLY